MPTTLDPNDVVQPSDGANYFRVDDDWRNATGKGVSVAIVDSGIDSAHPDLKGRVVESVEARLEDRRVVFHPSEAGDSAGHGTGCAGIVVRIAPDAELYSIKVLGAGGIGDGHAFLAALEYAINKRYRVINLSLGTTKPQFFSPLHDLLDRAYQAGCVVVAAANNLPQPSFPSVFSSSLISVSKSTASDPMDFGFNFGEVIELTAPGVNVRTTWPNGGHRNLTGNSFACPHIAGVIARLLERHPEFTPFQVKAALHAIALQNQSGKANTDK
jgi:subtilisin family serine protease